MKLHELHEGLFKSKVIALKNDNFTPEERALIKKHFPTGSNIDLKRPGKDEPLFPDNAHAVYGKGHLSFYKSNGKLHVSVGHYSNDRDPGDPKKSPMVHTDRAATDTELTQLKKDLK